MTDERPITRDAARAMMDQVKQAIAAGQDQATVDLAGTDVILEKTPEGGFILRAPGQSVGMRLFLDPATRPAEYPPDLPFVPGESVTATTHEGTSSLIWWSPRDPEGLFDEMERQLIAAGWVSQKETVVPTVPVTNRLYVKGALERSVIMSAGIVSLMQKPARPQKGEGRQ